jgi:hypothetical protein
VFGDGALVWSPDSAWVIGADADGKLEAFSASRSEGVRLDVGLSAITQVAVRASPAASG